MKKILFLTKSYPDFRKSATILCTHRVMEACAKSSEIEVHCLCLQYSGERVEEVVNGIHVTRIPQTLFEEVKYKKSVTASTKGRKLFHVMDRIQKTITIPLYPCISPLQLNRWENYAKQLYAKYRFDVVVAEHYGYNTLKTGLCLKKKYPSVKYVPLLWDPIDGQVITAKLPLSFTTKRIHQLELAVGNAADMVISTVAMKAYYDSHGDAFDNKRKYLDIPSVIFPEDEVETSHIGLLNKDYINIVFSGYIDSHRDINPVLDVLNNSKQAPKLNVVFFCKGVAKKDEAYWKDNFKGKITFHGYIPLPELHTIYRHADYLLNISSINPNLIPSKIFEYMSYGKPIISTYFTNGDAAKKYLDIYPESIVINQQESEEENINKMEKFLVSNHPIVEFKTVQELFSLNTPEKFVEILRELK